MKNSAGQHSSKITCSISPENTGELAVAATSAIDCTLSQTYCFGVDEIWL